MKKIFSVLVCVSVVYGCGYSSENSKVAAYTAPGPLGESAKFVVVSPSNRTSWLIESGSGEFKGLDLDTAPESSERFYQMGFTYDLLSPLGHEQGAVKFPLPAQFYDADFLTNLRTAKVLKTSRAVITHEGVADVTVNSGRVYKDCDKVQISFASGAIVEGSVESLAITLMVHPDLPALRAAAADITGMFHGFDVSAGLDYVEP